MCFYFIFILKNKRLSFFRCSYNHRNSLFLKNIVLCCALRPLEAINPIINHKIYYKKGGGGFFFSTSTPICFMRLVHICVILVSTCNNNNNIFDLCKLISF